MMRFGSCGIRHVSAVLLTVSLIACGGGNPPTRPQPPPVVNPPVNTDPPANTKPAIDSITVQGRRPRQPARFADVRETVDVSATVRDPETPIDELVYQWTATAGTATIGTFTGTGRVVTWTAPDSIAAATQVTITLKVVESFGHPGQAKIFSHDTTATVTIALHDSQKEVGKMSVDFLDAFSQPQTIKDWRQVMRDFNRSACPMASEFDAERESVEEHIRSFTMHAYTIGPPSVTVGFGSVCAFNLPGDACSSAQVMWNSTGPPGTVVVRGVDHLTAVYSTNDQRWWLCSSRFEPDDTDRRSFYAGR